MRPFENDTEVVSVSDLTIENGIDVIAIHGSIELSKDRLSLQRIEALQALLLEIKGSFDDVNDLPEKATAPEKGAVIEVITNPFGYE